MAWEFTPYSLPPLLAAIIAAGVAIETRRHRGEPGATTFLALMLLLFGWSASYAVQLGYTTVAEQLVWMRIDEIYGAFVPPIFLVFAMRYAGLERYLTPLTGAVLGLVPGADVALVLTNQFHHLVWTDASLPASAPAVVLTFGPAYYVDTALAYLMVAAGIAIIARIALDPSRTHRKQAAVLVAAAVVPFGANIAFTLGASPVPGLDLTTFTFAITGTLMALALFRFDLLDITPVARRHWIDQLGDGVVIVSRDGTVAEANDIARKVLDPPPTVGEPVSDSLPGVGSVLEAVSATVDGSRRHYDLRYVDLEDHHGNPAGSVLGLRDVTDRTEYEQRLKVANRVLRHNFRNAMNVVLGHAQALANDLPPAQAERARVIERRAREVIELNEEIQDVATTLDLQAPSAVVDVASLADEVVADSREAHPDVEFEVTTGEAAPVAVPDIDLLFTAVGNVVENAAEHNDASVPRVRVTVRHRDDRVVLRVADNGPGIPAVERLVIESGEETPLEHGSGLGLWLVSWVVSAADGEIRFEANDPRGSIVFLEFPVAEATEQSPAVADGSGDEP